MRITAQTPPAGTLCHWLDHHAAAAPGTISHLFADEGTTLTWSALRQKALGLAALFQDHGIERCESIAIMLENGEDAVTALFGCFLGGFRATPINLAAGRDAIAHALGHSRARLVIASARTRPLLDQARTRDPAALEVLDPAHIQPSRSVFEPVPIAPGDPALLMYSSGTTGRPKGVVHSHASLLAGGWTTAIAHELDARDRAMCVLPLYHINGLCVTLMAPLVTGGSTVISRRFSVTRFWAQCGAYEATWLSLVPTLVSHLLHDPNEPDAACRERLRFGRSASSPLAPDLLRAFERRFAVPLIETMGLTETAAQILSNPLPPGVRKPGSPGIAFGNEIAILGPDLVPRLPEVEGEIAVRGPNLMTAYLDDPQATEAAITAEGWLRTGDVGRLDEDGYVFVTGRLKELIIKGGENIAPREIDEVLHSFADVVEAAAFGQPCPVYGERIEAAVVLAPGSTLRPEAMSRRCAERLGAFKTPERIHLLPELPKGPSGKIQRLRLAELLR